jgi:hypothetical protein
MWELGVECWSDGVMEWWSSGVVEWWSGGVMLEANTDGRPSKLPGKFLRLTRYFSNSVTPELLNS